MQLAPQGEDKAHRVKLRNLCTAPELFAQPMSESLAYETMSTSLHSPCQPFPSLTDLYPSELASCQSWLVDSRPDLARMQLTEEQLQMSRQIGQTQSGLFIT